MKSSKIKNQLVIGICLALVAWTSAIPSVCAQMIWSGASDRNVVALTFDDGPKIEGSPEILDILYKEGVLATFFVSGNEAAQNPDILFRMADSGHDVANHFYSNDRITDVSYSRAIEGILKTNNVIFLATGVRPKFFRPPGGSYTNSLVNEISKMGLEVVGWSVNAEDFTEYTENFEIEENYGAKAAELSSKVISEARPGAIILLHNGSKQTILALPEIIKRLREKGYGFVTMSELAARKDY